jgi:hypothetical protein
LNIEFAPRLPYPRGRCLSRVFESGRFSMTREELKPLVKVVLANNQSVNAVASVLVMLLERELDASADDKPGALAARAAIEQLQAYIDHQQTEREQLKQLFGLE